jgi:hypothetical protein
MKFSLSTPSLVLFMSMACAVMTNAQADAKLYMETDSCYPHSCKLRNTESNQDRELAVNELNTKYLDGAASYNSGIKLKGSTKRYGVFRLEKGLNGEHLVFNSKKEANDFCADLSKATGSMYDYNSLLPRLPIYVIDAWDFRQVVAVPYWIAYNLSSYQTADGTSTPAKKYVVCTNPSQWKWEPYPSESDENETTGIESSDLKSGPLYNVTCVDPKKPKTAFWLESTDHPQFVKATNGTDHYLLFSSSLKTVHNYNEFVGAQYCTVS